jgi:transcription elongation GreA/GreB family factor
MAVAEPVWMTQQAYIRLQIDLAELRSRPTAANQARIRETEHLLRSAVVGEDPPDDGIAEPGMVLTVRDETTGQSDTVLLGIRGAEHVDIDVCSPRSPLGRAITGARPGEQRTYATPAGAAVTVTLLDAVPYAMRDTRPAVAAR